MNISPFKNYGRYFETYRRYIGAHIYALFILTVATSLLDGIGIVMLLPLVESTGIGGSNDYISSVFENIGLPESRSVLLVLIASIFLLKACLKMGEGTYTGYLNAYMSKRLKMSLFDMYSNTTYEYLSRNNPGHLINVMVGQTRQFVSSFVQFIAFNATVVSAIIYLGLASIMEWRFTVLAVVMGLSVLAAFHRISEYTHKLSTIVAKEKSTLNKLIIQTIQGLKYLIATNNVTKVRAGLYESIDRLTRTSFRSSVATEFTKSMIEPIAVIFLISVLAIQLFVLNGTIGPIIVALLLFYRALNSLLRMQTSWQGVMDKIGGLEMTDEEFRAVAKNQEISGSIRIDRLITGIEFKGVGFSYSGSAESQVLHDIDMRIPVNSTVAFVGESGAGKTTLVGLLTLMLRPTVGEIEIDGVTARDIDLPNWRSRIGYVSQETVVFDDTAANNISLWTGDYGDEEVRYRIHEAARRAHCHDFIMRLESGYETMVGDRGVRLSGGQRQRLFVARELYKNPELLLLDEATSALDSESEQYIKTSIDSLKGSVTVVIVAHRLSTIRNADLIYVLRAGRVRECGSYDELSSNTESAFTRMVALQEL